MEDRTKKLTPELKRHKTQCLVITMQQSV